MTMTEEPTCKDWRSVRPWLPPTGLTNRFDSRNPNHQGPAGRSRDHNHQHVEEHEELECWKAETEDGLRKRLRLKVIDVSSTAISLGVSFCFTPAPTPIASLDNNYPITLAIKLNGNPWRKVTQAHTDLVRVIFDDMQPPGFLHTAAPSLAARWRDSRLPGGQPSGIILVIHGLEPGGEYDVELEAIPNQHHNQAQAELDDLLHHHPFTHLPDHIPRPNTLPPESTQVSFSEDKSGQKEDAHTKAAELQPEPDGPPPPYTSHDPASPTTATPCSHSPSRVFSAESSHRSTHSSRARTTLVAGDESEGHVIVKTVPSTSTGKELKLISSINQMTKSLNKTAKENAKLRQRLVNLEKFICRLDDENLDKANRIENLGRSSGEAMEQEIEAQGTKASEKRAKLEDQEKDQARQLAELKERNRAMRRKADESARRVSEMKEKKLKAMDAELKALKNELEEVDRLIAAGGQEQPFKKPASMHKNVARLEQGVGRHNQGKMRSVEELRSFDVALLSKPISVRAQTSAGGQKKLLGRTGSLNEKSRPGMVVGGVTYGSGRRVLKENQQQQVNKTWADKVAGH